jgi:DHA1 family tetracycline resistance protein-like MFS transporter
MGKLGDRYGRRPVLLLCLLGQALGYVIFGLGGSLWILYLGRLIGGITGGSISTASACIADISQPHERAKNFTLIGIAWSLGLIVGPAAGALLGELSLNAPAFASAGLVVVGTIVSFFVLPETLPKQHRNTAALRLRDFNPIHAILEMARKPGLAWLLLAYALFILAANGVNSTASIFYIAKFAADPAQVGSIMTVAGIALGFVQFLLVGRFVKRFGDKRVLMVSLLGQAVSYLGVFLVPSLWLVFLVNMLATAFSGFIFPTINTLCINYVEHREVGLLLGVITAIGSLMNIFGPLYGGLVFDYVMPGAPFWMATILYFLTIITIWKKG